MSKAVTKFSAEVLDRSFRLLPDTNYQQPLARRQYGQPLQRPGACYSD